MFTLKKTDKNTKARRGVIQTAHGSIESPFFMPVGTNGTVKSLTFEDLCKLGAQMMLSNTYHLYLRPGEKVFKEMGGLHGLSKWDKPILTDSGGYQVFSLAKFRKLSDEGVIFKSHLDGSSVNFTPESVVDYQCTIGSDMMMPLDECAPYPCERAMAEESVERTFLWAKRSKEYFEKNRPSDYERFLFGIVQGSTYKDLRELAAKQIVSLDFDSYAIGGVSVGETVKDMFYALDWVIPFLPENKARYFMGIGLPDQMVKAVGEGIDMFDTVLPTRFGRHATAFTRKGRLLLRNAPYKNDDRPIDESCACHVCQNYSRAYLRHLANLKEISGLTLISYHNLYFYVNLMKEIRVAIENDQYQEFQKDFLSEYGSQLLETI